MQLLLPDYFNVWRFVWMTGITSKVDLRCWPSPLPMAQQTIRSMLEQRHSTLAQHWFNVHDIMLKKRRLPSLGPFSGTNYDKSWASDWSRWLSRPIRGLRYIATCTRIRSWTIQRTFLLVVFLVWCLAWSGVRFMLGRRRRRWANMNPTPDNRKY